MRRLVDRLRSTTLAARRRFATFALLAALPVALLAATPLQLPQALRELPHDKYAELVAQGYRMFVATPTYAPRYAGNALSCSNCHLDAGTRPHASPLGAAWGEYPAYLAKNDRVMTFEERVQDCFRYSLNGLAPPLDSQELRAIVAYAQWTARGAVVGGNAPGRGFPTIARTGSDPNALRGRDVYGRRCAACHGGDGAGRATSGGVRLAPPLWGLHSYNKGAGFARVDLLAGFVKANMPLGAADLTDQEALDVAAWVDLQERWPDPRKGLLRGFLDR